MRRGDRWIAPQAADLDRAGRFSADRAGTDEWQAFVRDTEGSPVEQRPA